MAALPIKPLPTGSVTIEGTDVPIRALSFTETKAMVSLNDDTDAADVLVLTAGTGATDDEARAWLAGTDAATVNDLLLAILRLSGLASSDPRSGSTGEGPAERPSSEP